MMILKLTFLKSVSSKARLKECQLEHKHKKCLNQGWILNAIF